MSEQRKLTTILVSDVVAYSRLAGADEELTLARLRALRSDLIDPIVSVHHGRIVNRTGDGSLVEFGSAVDAVRCAIEVQTGLIERNAGLPPERRIEFRIGIHLGDVMVESDGDLMGEGVNIAARLEGICAPGAICLSEQAYWQVKSRLDLAVTDLGDRELKNIADKVHVFSLEVGKPARAKPTALAPKRRNLLLPLIAGLVALAMIAGGAWYFFVGSKSVSVVANAPAHLSIVVLPFANLSDDPKQDYFADGITENLTTDLSRIRNSFVIARNTAFTYKGKNVDAKEIGKELDVRYVLEGSVQREGNRVRVNAQLIDAESGAHLWADRFEDDIADLFKLQDEVVARLANTLGRELVKAEAAKGARSKNPDAIDLVMRGRASMLLLPPTRDNYHAARTWFAQALAIDPNYADALSADAQTYVADYLYGWSTAPTDYDKKILPTADRAIALDPDNVWAYYVKSLYLYLSNRPSESLGAANAGLAANPNAAPLYAVRQGSELSLGRFEQAKADIQQAMRLSPRDPSMGAWHFTLGTVQLESRNFDAAIDEGHQAIDAGFRAFQPYAILAAAYAFEGKMEEAKTALAAARRVNSALTIKWFIAHAPTSPTMVEGLRKAGLPEDDGPKLSIVVLPFTNLSGDPKQDYLADVLTDELTTYLSRIPGSFVIARNTAFTYKGKPTDVKVIGKDLGVRYVLEGSVQPTEKRIRTNAQLIDTETGAHLWAEEFDQDRGDLLQIQDDIVTRLARSMQIQLTDIEVARLQRAHPTDPDAQELALRCQASYWNVGPLGKQAEAGFHLCEQALEIDANNVVALAILAHKFIVRVLNYRSPDREAEISRADELASRALVLDPNNPDARDSKAEVLTAQRRFEESRAEAERALALNPSQMDAYITLCNVEIYTGQAERLIAVADRAIQLSPRDPLRFVWFGFKGDAYFMLRRDDQAAEWFRRSIAIYPNYGMAHAYLAATLALTGHEAEAHEALAQYLSMPGTLVKTIAAYKRQRNSDNPIYLAMRERFVEGARQAGLPEDDGPRLSIVVLPFTNLSGDPKQDYFADGITENLTTDLSRSIHGAFVIARNTAFTYKGKNVDAKEIGRELGVHYVLEGSVQREGNRVRVNAQLIDAEKGEHLWADRFDDDLAELFKLQDEVVARLARALSLELVNEEARRGLLDRPQNPDAIDLTMQGWALLNRSLAKDTWLAARDLFEQALKTDPANLDARVGLAYFNERDSLYSFTGGSQADAYARSMEQIDGVIAVDPNHAFAHYVKTALLVIKMKDVQSANETLDAAQTTLRLDPSLAVAYHPMAIAEEQLDHCDASKSDLEQAIKVSPRDPGIGLWRSALAREYFCLHQNAAAIREEQNALDSGYRTIISYLALAAFNAASGNDPEAKGAMAEAMKLNPKLSVAWFHSHLPEFIDNPPGFIDAARKAGLPEE